MILLSIYSIRSVAFKLPHPEAPGVAGNPN